MALQQVLQELSDLVPLVPPRVAEVLEAGQELQERMAAARRKMEELEPACTRVAEEVLGNLRVSADGQQGDHVHWQTSVGRHEEIRKGLQSGCAVAAERLRRAGAAAADTLEHLYETGRTHGVLEEFEERQIRTTRHNAEIATRQARGLGDLVATLARTQQEVLAALGAAHNEAMAACDRLAGRIAELQEETADGLDDLASRTEAAVEQAAAGLESCAGTMEEGGAAALLGLQRVLAGAHGAEVLGPGELIRSVMDHSALAAGLASALAAAQGDARALFEPLLDGVSALLDPVEMALGAVRGAASLVGLGE